MSRIRSKDTAPELIVRKFLFSKGFRYKLHDTNLAGTPDLVLNKFKVLIFVHGCFWHGHSNCKYYKTPKTRTDWWLKKINRNKELDAINYQKLFEDGWRIITVFECELNSSLREITLCRIIREINIDNPNH